MVKSSIQMCFLYSGTGRRHRGAESCRFGCRAGVGGVTVKVSEEPTWETPSC